MSGRVTRGGQEMRAAGGLGEEGMELETAGGEADRTWEVLRGGRGEGQYQCAEASWTRLAGGDSIQLIPETHEVGRCGIQASRQCLLGRVL